LEEASDFVNQFSSESFLDTKSVSLQIHKNQLNNVSDTEILN